MKTLKNCLIAFGVVLILFIIYAHTLHSSIFFSRQPIIYADNFKLKAATEVFFKINKLTLTGRLKLPDHSTGKVPAILFCVGSGGESSYSTTFYSKFLDSLFEQNLSKDSIAFFYFEKRGVGKSEGNWYDTDFEQRAEDVKAAADFLKTIPSIDSNKLIVVGHSQGGWISQICLAKYPNTFAAGISMAGPTFSVKEQVINDYSTRFQCKEAMNENDAKRKAVRQVNLDFLLTSLFPVKQEWRQLTLIKNFDPAPFLAEIKKPLLLLYCENDALVSPKACIARLTDLFPGGIPRNIETCTLKGANHSFKLSDLCYAGPYRNIPFSEEGKQVIREWIKKIK